MAKEKPELVQIDGREVRVTSPSRVYFPEAGVTKLDVVRYYQVVAQGALRGIRDRPIVLKRYVKGIHEEFFFQKRAPAKRPDWLDVVKLSFPSGRSAEELVINQLSQLIWTVNLGCLDLNPHPTRADDLDHPDELRVDLDPGPGADWPQVRRVAMAVKEVLDEHALVGWPKTSGSRGIHVNIRIERRYSFKEVRRAALALARAVEQRLPEDATSKWWKEERHGVFIDYNQNARDRTVASAYSLRPVPEARVSAPLRWDEVPDCEPNDFTIFNMPARYEQLGDLHAGIDDAPCSLDSLLELSAKHEAEGLGDEPSPDDGGKGAGGKKTTGGKKKAGGKKKGGRRVSKMPLITVSQAKKKEDALAGLERWKLRYPEAAAKLDVEDVLVDAMRGRSSMWWRIRVNLRHVPEAQRPPQETPDPDYDPWRKWRQARGKGQSS